MIILPAIDMMDGRVVRLRQGKADEQTFYEYTPVEIAKQWEDQGAEWIHLVDLDGAFEGESKNLEAVRAICEAVTIPCELGGGIRDMQALEKVMDAGVARAIIGSKAADEPEFVKEAAEAFGGEKIAVGIDAKDGKVATKGWVEVTEWDAKEFAVKMQEMGAGTIIYTDIATDGMLKGPNVKAMEEMLEILDVNLIASGGVSVVDDVKRLGELDGLYGVIVGKALYEKRVTLEELLEITQ